MRSYTTSNATRECAGFGVIFIAETVQPGFDLSPVCEALVEDADMTNNRAEIKAAIRAVKRSCRWNGVFVLHTDSGVVWNWYHTLRRKHLLDQYSSLDNGDLWVVLNASIGEREMAVVKVRSHNGNVQSRRGP
jgi:ribonuclease HI